MDQVLARPSATWQKCWASVKREHNHMKHTTLYGGNLVKVKTTTNETLSTFHLIYVVW